MSALIFRENKSKSLFVIDNMVKFYINDAHKDKITKAEYFKHG